MAILFLLCKRNCSFKSWLTKHLPPQPLTFTRQYFMNLISRRVTCNWANTMNNNTFMSDYSNQRLGETVISAFLFVAVEKGKWTGEHYMLKSFIKVSLSNSCWIKTWKCTVFQSTPDGDACLSPNKRELNQERKHQYLQLHEVNPRGAPRAITN